MMANNNQGNRAQQALEEETEISECNQLESHLRSCYVNEVKSAKELKISIKGEHVYFFPNLAFNCGHNPNVHHLLDFRSRRPVVAGGFGLAPDPMNLNA